MKVGFTGTQVGMTDKQKEEVKELLEDYVGEIGDAEFHHGDCIGADKEARDIAYSVGFYIHNHPPINPIKRAYCIDDKWYEPKEYIARNHDIVDCCDILIATPKETEEQLRSGTWATIRYARKTGKPVEIIWP